MIDDFILKETLRILNKAVSILDEWHCRLEDIYVHADKILDEKEEKRYLEFEKEYDRLIWVIEGIEKANKIKG